MMMILLIIKVKAILSALYLGINLKRRKVEALQRAANWHLLTCSIYSSTFIPLYLYGRQPGRNVQVGLQVNGLQSRGANWTT